MKLLKDKVNSDVEIPDYPLGKIRDDDGDGYTGSQVDAEFMNDYVQFMEKMFADSGLTANDDPDNETNGYQLYDAFKRIIDLRIGVKKNVYRINQNSSSDPTIEHTYYTQNSGVTINLSRDVISGTQILYEIEIIQSGLNVNNCTINWQTLYESENNNAGILTFGGFGNNLAGTGVVLILFKKYANVSPAADGFKGILEFSRLYV
jgi:hypothetical protein